MANDSENMAEVERIFKRFDANGDGKISSSELGDALKTLGSATADEIQRMMAEIDTDGCVQKEDQWWVLQHESGLKYNWALAFWTWYH
ncbi:hypothetical protein HHK36_014860 [Tetracentron sinense]|uniref:EF-hand domain-containing protein n=1 Tax=Tetracentron sinense TaxID=13715 RepID=A0A834Z3N5_TETSI|nr:hypothetical protein HHK36_014860 [Tetracentron sinense]